MNVLPVATAALRAWRLVARRLPVTAPDAAKGATSSIPALRWSITATGTTCGDSAAYRSSLLRAVKVSTSSLHCPGYLRGGGGGGRVRARRGEVLSCVLG